MTAMRALLLFCGLLAAVQAGSDKSGCAKKGKKQKKCVKIEGCAWDYAISKCVDESEYSPMDVNIREVFKNLKKKQIAGWVDNFLIPLAEDLKSQCGQVSEDCVDTPGWKNKGETGHTCTVYAKNWCAYGRAREGMEETLGAVFNYPEDNCCACGKADLCSDADCATEGKCDQARYVAPAAGECCGSWDNTPCASAEHFAAVGTCVKVTKDWNAVIPAGTTGTVTRLSSDPTDGCPQITFDNGASGHHPHCEDTLEIIDCPPAAPVFAVGSCVSVTAAWNAVVPAGSTGTVTQMMADGCPQITFDHGASGHHPHCEDTLEIVDCPNT